MRGRHPGSPSKYTTVQIIMIMIRHHSSYTHISNSDMDDNPELSSCTLKYHLMDWNYPRTCYLFLLQIRTFRFAKVEVPTQMLMMI